jgi:hypothetical protein
VKSNRSIPTSTVIPVLIYPDVREAVAWLCAAFGFEERLRIGEDHRSQLQLGDGAVILGDVRGDRRPPRPGEVTHSVTVRVEDARTHLRAGPGTRRAHPHGADRFRVRRAPVQRRGLRRSPVDVLGDARRRCPRDLGRNDHRAELLGALTQPLPSERWPDTARRRAGGAATSQVVESNIHRS